MFVVVIAKIGLETVYRLERLSQKAMYNIVMNHNLKRWESAKHGLYEDLPSLASCMCCLFVPLFTFSATEVPDETHGLWGTSSKSSLQSSMDFLALRVAPESHVPCTETLQPREKVLSVSHSIR